ncbi:MAG: hypothetical protein ACJAS4_000815 [Bacteriovoracaceae bacterium]|jgi:hypothetical protein
MSDLTNEKEFIHELMNLLTQVNMRIDIVNKLIDQEAPDITEIKKHSKKASISSHKLIELARQRRESLA